MVKREEIPHFKCSLLEQLLISLSTKPQHLLPSNLTNPHSIPHLLLHFYGHPLPLSSSSTIHNMSRENNQQATSVFKRKTTTTTKTTIMDQEKNYKTAEEEEDDERRMMSCSKKIGKKRYNLLCFHELPDYMKDNEFILRYYRSEWPLKLAFLSLFRWHNETLNVWTHLIGLLLFLGLTLANAMHVSEVAEFITMFAMQFPSSAEANFSNKSSTGSTNLLDLKKRREPSGEMAAAAAAEASSTESWPFYVFLGGAMFCLLCSCACHLFCCHSRRLTTHLLHLDYVGIAVMIIASFFPPMYYIFQCTPHWQIVYLTGISVLGACTIITLLTPALSSGKCRFFRVLLFVSMALFGIIPAVHASVVYWRDPHRNVILAYEGVMALCYLTGTGFYVSRVPERWRPGWFDLAGQSHQIFHVFVVLGALAHYGAADIFLRYRSKMGCDKLGY